jgi:hypothetical protein
MVMVMGGGAAMGLGAVEKMGQFQFECIHIQTRIGISPHVKFYLAISLTSKQWIWYCNPFPKLL